MRTRPALCTIIAVAILAMAGCGSDAPAQPPIAQPAGPAAATQPQPPACKTVFVVGEVIDATKVKGGCTDPNGGVQVPGSFTCGDGRQLFQVDANTGAEAGWGFGGSKYTASADAAADPKYKDAYEKCNN